MAAQSQPTYDGVPVEVEDTESHRGEEMVLVAVSGDEEGGWVFAEELEGYDNE